MSSYLIKYENNKKYQCVVEAENIGEAESKFYEGEFSEEIEIDSDGADINSIVINE